MTTRHQSPAISFTPRTIRAKSTTRTWETPIPGTNISGYLNRRLQDLGARHVFGYYMALDDNELDVNNTCDEQDADLPQ